jgi:AcrR family transcriptional regulator
MPTRPAGTARAGRTGGSAVTRAAITIRNGREEPDGTATRERILDIALRLFVTQGYDRTSLRQIADEMGFTKAALYYHFASKNEMLLALHLRLHDALTVLEEPPTTVEGWGQAVEILIDELLGRRDLLALHARNQSALATIPHHQPDDRDHVDLEDALKEVLANPSVPTRDRVRLAAALGAAGLTMILSGSVLSDVGDAELGDLLRDVVRVLTGPG